MISTRPFRRRRTTLVVASAGALVAAAGLFGGSTSGNQVFVTPKGQADNVRFSVVAGGVVQVTYDLVSDDPRATFAVNLEVSDDAGRSWNVRPKSLTGD